MNTLERNANEIMLMRIEMKLQKRKEERDSKIKSIIT